jgi:geranylgeranyl diphosphate synthase, type I
LAGASDELLEGYQAFGDALGIAFQLQDDLLGAFGDPAAMGKPSGDDLRDGKRTVLVAEALARVGDRRAVEELVAGGTADSVEDLRGVLVRSGARAAVEERIRGLGREAMGCVNDLPLRDEGVRAELSGLVEMVTGFVSERSSGPVGVPPRVQEPPRTAA